MQGVFSAYKNGLQMVWKSKKLLFLIYGVNFIFAYFLAMPVSMMLANALEKTRAADKALESFDYAIFTSVMVGFGQGISFSRLLITIGLFYLIMNVFLSGGILSMFVQSKQFNMSEFLSDCAVFFNRFLKLFLISLAFVLFMISIFLLIGGLFTYFTEDAETEHLSLILLTVRFLLLGIMAAFIVLIFDYAKIIAVSDNSSEMLNTVKMALLFIARNLFGAVGLFKMYLFTAVGLIVLYLSVENIIHVSSSWMVVMFLIWTQIYMLLKLSVRLGFFAGQWNYYRHNNASIRA